MNRLVAALTVVLSFPPGALAQAPSKFDLMQCRETDARTVLAAAENGDADAMVCMGFKYANGRQVPRDDVQAAHWWIKSAEAGQSGGMFWAGIAFWSGRGIKQDMVEGYKWLDLSIKFTAGTHQPARTALDGLTRVLSPQQITEAKKRGADWEKGFQAKRARRTEF